MAINISNLLVKYLKGSILDLDEFCLCLSNVFYFSSICIESAKALFFSYVLRKQNKRKREQKEVKTTFALNKGTLF